MVLGEGDIKLPVQCVLDSPVATHRLVEPLAAHASTRDVVTDITAVFAMVVLRDGDRPAHRIQPHPLLFEQEVIGQLCQVVIPIIDVALS